MYGLPQSTLIRKQLPKSQIYAKFDLKHSERESFDKDVSRIDIVAVVSSRTVPAVAEGTEVKEFYLLEVQLKKRDYDIKNIKRLTDLIPQRMVFALHFEEQTQFAIYHTKLIVSQWQATKDTTLSLSGLNVDTVWENVVKQVGQINVADGKTLNEQIKVDEERIDLQKKIVALVEKLNKEKQFNRQMEINAEIKILKKKLSNLK